MSLALLEAIERLEPSIKRSEEQAHRIAALTANLILLLKRADASGANVRLQQQAALNQILDGQTQLLAMLSDPAALAGIASRSVIDQARQIKRRNEQAINGHDTTSAGERREHTGVFDTHHTDGTRKEAMALVGEVVWWGIKHSWPVLLAAATGAIMHYFHR